MLPFSETQFFDLFARYNEAIWPAQIAAYVLGLIAIGGVLAGSKSGTRVALACLGSLWAWTGIFYHFLFFAEINSASPIFGALFVAQSIVLFNLAARPSFWLHYTGAAQAAGLAMVAYAAVIYPLLNAWLGHAYPHAPSFGVTPCPLVIFTFGMLLLTPWRAPWALFVVPVLWAVIGGSAAILFGVMPDLALPISAVIAIALNARKSAKSA